MYELDAIIKLMIIDHWLDMLKGRGIVDLTETMEELYSLLLLIGHVLADEGEGETPLVCLFFFIMDLNYFY